MCCRYDIAYSLIINKQFSVSTTWPCIPYQWAFGCTL